MSDATPRTLITATLSVRRGYEAIEFYKAAFGATVLHQVGDASNVVARLAVNGAEFWLSDESPEHLNFSPETLGGCSVRMLLMTDDPDAVCARAVAAGAYAGRAGVRGARLAHRPHPRPVRAPLGNRAGAVNATSRAAAPWVEGRCGSAPWVETHGIEPPEKPDPIVEPLILRLSKHALSQVEGDERRRRQRRSVDKE